jgi:hypothetical protein
LEDTSQFLQRGSRVGDLAEHADDVGGIESRVLIGQSLRVSPVRRDVANSGRVGATVQNRQHLGLDVDDVETAAGRESCGDRERIDPDARADLEDALARSRGEDRSQPRFGERPPRQIEHPSQAERHR